MQVSKKVKTRKQRSTYCMFWWNAVFLLLKRFIFCNLFATVCMSLWYTVFAGSIPWTQTKKKQVKQHFFKQDSDTLMGARPHWRKPPFDANAAPAWVVKALAIPGKTGFTSFGKVDLPFHAPVSQQSAKTRRHSSTGLEFHDHQENSFNHPPPPHPAPRPSPHSAPEKKSSCLFFFPKLCPANSAASILSIFSKYTFQNIICKSWMQFIQRHSQKHRSLQLISLYN